MSVPYDLIEGLYQTCSEDTVGMPCRVGYDQGSTVYESYSECAQSVILLPGFNLLPNWFLVVVYGAALAWTFFGVAIISDIFMEAIEQITSAEYERTITHPKTGETRIITYQVWNATVANLTLMALGSSAPEIMLAVLEAVIGLGKPPGELGPSTIVGSAAFNLLMITSVCIVSVPDGETRMISDFPVFVCTAAFSLWAYFWMLIVYKIWTPDEITLVEAFLTLAYLPIMVGLAYLISVKIWLPRPDPFEGEDDNGTTNGYERIVGVDVDYEGHHYHIGGDTIAERQAHDEAHKRASAQARASQEVKQIQAEHAAAQAVQGNRIGAVLESDSENLAERQSNNQGADVQVTDLDLDAQVQSLESQAVAEATTDDGPRESLNPAGFGLGGGGQAHSPIPSHLSYGSRRGTKEAPQIDRTELARKLEDIDENDVQSLQQVAGDILGQQPVHMTAMQYKMNARKAIAGKTHVAHNPNLTASVAPAHSSSKSSLATMSFAANTYTCTERQGTVRLRVTCDRKPQEKSSTIKVIYRTRDGLAVGGDTADGDCDYETQSGELVFAPGESSKELQIRVFEDEKVESDEDFYVDLEEVLNCPVEFRRRTATVIIMDSTEPGRLMMAEACVQVVNSASEARIAVTRRHGSEGAVSVDYRTQDGTAVAGVAYQAVEGTLEFESGEREKEIVVPLLPGRGQADETFSLFIMNPKTASLAKRRTVCEIQFVEDPKIGTVMKMVNSILRRNQEVNTPTNSWIDQFKEAIIPGGEVVLEEGASTEHLEASDYILHFISFSFKVVFATVPPAEYYSGAPCFAVSILYIGLLTYIVGEFSTMFGCACGLPPAVTAISFVALGTSLPDTFASRQAALEAPDADAAIGNVTGSNSVNVFLGLGLPWVISAIYYAAKGQAYIAPAGALAFSVAVYMATAVVCLVLLYYKRCMCGGELGGSGANRNGIALVLACLWVAYLVISSLQATGRIQGF